MRIDMEPLNALMQAISEEISRTLYWREKKKTIPKIMGEVSLYESLTKADRHKVRHPKHSIAQFFPNRLEAIRKKFKHEGAAEAVIPQGYIEGNSSGTTDDVPVNLPENCYVVDATTVSLLGNGNSQNGAKHLDEFVKPYMRQDFVRYPDPHSLIPAMVSDGEYIIPPHVVEALGKGNNAKGVKILDKARKQLRKQKGLKTFLPPKTKSLGHYMRGVKF